MSEHGFKVRNEKSQIQIDSNYTNYVLEVEGSLTLQGLQTVNITSNINPPIAVIRPTGGTNEVCGVLDVKYTAPNYTGVQFFGGRENTTTGTCAFDYKIYTLPQNRNDETHGIRVYNPNGKLSFESANSFLKILEVGSATIGTTYTHSGIVSPYYIFSPWHSRILGIYFPPQGPVYSMKSGIMKQSTTSVKGGWTTAGQLGVTNMNFDANSGTSFNLIMCE